MIEALMISIGLAVSFGLGYGKGSVKQANVDNASPIFQSASNPTSAGMTLDMFPGEGD